MQKENYFKYSQTKKARKQVKILGVKLTSTSRVRVLRFVRERIKEDTKFYIVTPNPEIIILAQSDKTYKRILNFADLSLADGIGLAQAHKFLSLPNPKEPVRRFLTLLVQGLAMGFLTVVDRKRIKEGFEVITGRQMFLELVRLANKKGWRVFLLGGETDVADKTRELLSHGLKKVKIESDRGPRLDTAANPVSSKDRKAEKKAILEINRFNPHLLFVAFGAPKQEKWVYKNLPKLNVGGAMTVGGTFDYISGKANLPPEWVENLGLEWTWRLLTQPKRARRVATAFPIFPLKIFWHKFTS